MDLPFACALCGMDPGTDGLVLQAALAAAIATPWYLRSRALNAVRALRRRLRGVSAATDACPLPRKDDTPPT